MCLLIKAQFAVGNGLVRLFFSPGPISGLNFEAQGLDHTSYRSRVHVALRGNDLDSTWYALEYMCLIQQANLFRCSTWDWSCHGDIWLMLGWESKSWKAAWTNVCNLLYNHNFSFQSWCTQFSMGSIPRVSNCNVEFTSNILVSFTILHNNTAFDLLEGYVTSVLSRYQDDSRINMWDLWNGEE